MSARANNQTTSNKVNIMPGVYVIIAKTLYEIIYKSKLFATR